MIMPIGDDKSETREMADGMVEMFTPMLSEKGYEIIASHTILKGGNITKQIVNLLINADLVVANLTNLNSNVMYELGIRHATGKYVIIMAQHGTDLPFDIKQERTTFFYDKIVDSKKLISTVSSFIDSIDFNKLDDNPVTSVIQQSALAKADILDDATKVLYNQNEKILARLAELDTQTRKETLNIKNITGVTLTYELISVSEAERVAEYIFEHTLIRPTIYNLADDSTQIKYALHHSNPYAQLPILTTIFEQNGLRNPDYIRLKAIE